MCPVPSDFRQAKQEASLLAALLLARLLEFRSSQPVKLFDSGICGMQRCFSKLEEKKNLAGGCCRGPAGRAEFEKSALSRTRHLVSEKSNYIGMRRRKAHGYTASYEVLLERGRSSTT